ncbi:hypothetical protein CQ020_05705 [Arthrobacter sp. MYb23]|uniref:hypothetical protein n=1 Tax=unclassified Arthrobacter TaxID=235627 RepID=UPI000CFDD943|nr:MULTISPECIES: hypothetical protein [unclassified Arthrobacter]PRB42990.1 hypothetical protein CQ038_08335 [Arthrobacter sp. MYb51]PRB97943.1 hypothetical protein CQ020_05705 [Arthrobacter sp. MYb23]
MFSISPSLLLTSAVIAALLTATINIVLARRRSREEERARVRTVFAEAFAAYAQYKEYPYVIRRRNADKPAEERVRISEQIRATQEKLSYYLAWTAAESSVVGSKYADLVHQMRAVAGTAMKDAWRVAPITEDSSMVIPTSEVNLSGLKGAEEAYRAAVAVHLAKLSPWWAH